MKFFLSLLLLLASTAYATDDPKPEIPAPPVSSESISGAVAGSKSISAATAEGGHATGGTSSATQSQTASSTASNAGNSQNLNIESSYRERRQAPSSFAPAIYASGPCAYGWSAALSVPGGSVGGGKAKADPACDRREVARVLTPLNPQLALKVLCADPIVAQVAGEKDCVYSAPEVVIENSGPPAPAIDLSRYVTREEMVERDKRIMQKAAGK